MIYVFLKSDDYRTHAITLDPAGESLSGKWHLWLSVDVGGGAVRLALRLQCQIAEHGFAIVGPR